MKIIRGSPILMITLVLLLTNATSGSPDDDEEDEKILKNKLENEAVEK